MQFYGHLLRMGRNRLANKIFEFFNRRTAEHKRFREVRIDLANMGVTEVNIVSSQRSKLSRTEEKNWKRTEDTTQKKEVGKE